MVMMLPLAIYFHQDCLHFARNFRLALFLLLFRLWYLQNLSRKWRIHNSEYSGTSIQGTPSGPKQVSLK